MRIPCHHQAYTAELYSERNSPSPTDVALELWPPAAGTAGLGCPPYSASFADSAYVVHMVNPAAGVEAMGGELQLRTAQRTWEAGPSEDG